MGVYGIILAGWAANSNTAFLGAMRSAAQIVAYEIAMGFAMVGVLMRRAASTWGTSSRRSTGDGSVELELAVSADAGLFHFRSGGDQPAPFDVAEGESEIVAGFHVDYSGMAFALFFIAEYVNMILISALTCLFFGDGSRPSMAVPGRARIVAARAARILLVRAENLVPMFTFLWLRATFPRLRYDQIMRLGWKALIR